MLIWSAFLLLVDCVSRAGWTGFLRLRAYFSNVCARAFWPAALRCIGNRCRRGDGVLLAYPPPIRRSSVSSVAFSGTPVFSDAPPTHDTPVRYHLDRYQSSTLSRMSLTCWLTGVGLPSLYH